MTKRVDLGQRHPDLYQAVLRLETLASQAATSAGLSPGFYHLMKLRASQVNGCAYCLRMHARDAQARGETPERLSVLPAWRETTYFTDRERAALALVEAVTRVSEGQIPDDVYAGAAAVLSDEEIAAVEWTAVVINAWNRIAIASRYAVGPEG